MIPADFIAEWRARTRWASDLQVEQDLVLSRALAEIFSDPELQSNVALRGGTALHKLCFSPSRRYSDDIDLVQLKPEPFGPTMDRLRARLDPWLGTPKRDRGQGVRLIYRFDSELPPVVRLRLKIETNTREHFAAGHIRQVPYHVESRWWQGSASVTTFSLDELLGTKLRALYQRKKGRDLFDLWLALESGLEPKGFVARFLAHMNAAGIDMTRAIFEQNLAGKIDSPQFVNDIQILLPPGTSFDLTTAAAHVQERIIALLPGDPWKGDRRAEAED